MHKHPKLGVYVNVTDVGAEKVSSLRFDLIWVRIVGEVEWKAKSEGVCGLG